MYWQQEYECMAREELLQFQLERLQSTLTRVSRNVPFYRGKFEELDIDSDDFRSLDDLKRLPFTTKTDIRDNYPYGLFAVPLREVVRLHSSTGTTGASIVVGYTRNDIHKWSDLAARVLCAGGVTKDDLVQIAFNYGLFTGGFGLHYGTEHIGASVIPSSGGNARGQIRIMQDYRTTALACTPSYALHLADVMDEMGVDMNSLHLKHGLFGAEPWSEAMRAEIEERLKITATDNYGVSEVMGPGVAGECLERAGMHVNEDHFLVEILNPSSGEPVADGEIGELVITTLAKEAFPMIRFRTGDLTRILPEPCPCGRTLCRIEKILGRCDDTLIIRGIAVSPSQVEAVVQELEQPTPTFQMVVERGEDHLDKATVYVEASESLLYDSVKQAQALIEGLRRRLAADLGIHFEVVLVGKKSLEREEGEVRRVIDRRSF